MDFVDWCDQVLLRIAESTTASTPARSTGLDQVRLWVAVFGEAIALGGGFQDSDRHVALMHAVLELEREHLIEQGGQGRWRLTDLGEQVLPDRFDLWAAICQQPLTPERRQVLEIINRLSPHVVAPEAAYAWLDAVSHEDVLPAMGWSADQLGLIHAIVRELEERHLIARRGLRLHATYRGLVWQTRRGVTVESRLIDGLVAEWETTSVDFKQEVHTDSPSDKAELIKDILALANTQASGRRWLIVGFHPKTHAYAGPPAPKLTQDHIEDLLSAYTRPVPRIDYRVVAYRLGPVGQLEVLREPRNVPYRVKKALGDRAVREKRIEVDEVFVRHNSHTARADELEIADLEADERECAGGRTHHTGLERWRVASKHRPAAGGGESVVGC